MDEFHFRARSWSRRQAHLVCAGVWTISLFTPITALLTKSNDVSFDYRRYTCNYGFSHSSWWWLKPLFYGLFGLLPNVTVVVSTVLLLVEARKSATAARRPLRWPGTMTVILTATVYSFSILPISLYQIVEAALGDGYADTSLFSTYFLRLSISFVNLNVVANFFIYYMTVSSFRIFLNERLGLITRIFRI
jgi:hypothetical protein